MNAPAPAPTRSLRLAGWGLFNFTEGLVDHHLLGLHHVRPGHPHELFFDLLFLASGLLFAGLGSLLMHHRSPHAIG